MRRALAQVIIKSTEKTKGNEFLRCGGGSRVLKDSHLYTFAQLQAEAREGVRRLKDAHTSLQTELNELRSRILLLVRSIWGGHSTAILAQLREKQGTVSNLIRRWEDAEHRLIAVANSLTSLKAGQRLVAVGAPLAAAHLLQPNTAAAYCYENSKALSYPLIGSQRKEPPLGLLRSLVEGMADELALLQRSLFLFFLFLPLVLTSPVLILSNNHRDSWLNLMRWTLERAGPAFIKWGQWAATRADLFPPDICATLAELQTKAPSHKFQYTRAAVESAFQRPLRDLFLEFDERPVASGSIAQVHRAVLSPAGAALAKHRTLLGGLLPLPAPSRRRSQRSHAFETGATVAVKVRHPGVNGVMEQDFALMRRAAAFIGALPGFNGGPQLKESLMQFGAPMREQLDLRAEAAHLARFADNFRWWWGVRFPLPAAPTMVTEDVLVESFEEGDHISSYVGTEFVHNKKLADLGMNCYLKMLLLDNYIHADLHPGNILVRIETPAPGSITDRIGAAMGWDLSVPKLVLLDVGMTARLTREDQSNLVDFFTGLTSLDGGVVADAIMKFSEGKSDDPRRFRGDMAALFAALEPEYVRTHTQEVIKDMMDTIRSHGMHLKGVVSTVVFSTMVLEGWSTKLDPDIRILENLKHVIPSGWKERMAKMVEKISYGEADLLSQ